MVVYRETRSVVYLRTRTAGYVLVSPWFLPTLSNIYRGIKDCPRRDFTLAMSKPNETVHDIICILYMHSYHPPTISFETRCEIGMSAYGLFAVNATRDDASSCPFFRYASDAAGPSASFNVNQCDTWMCPRFVHPYSLSWD